MTKYLNLTAIAALLAVGLWSCKAFPGASVNCSPDPIEVHADSIKFSIKASLPPKSGIKKKGTYMGDAQLAGSSMGKLTFSTLNNPSIVKLGIDTTIALKGAYNPKMDGNNVMIKQSYERKGKTFELPNIENLCQCCITTSYLVYENAQYVWSTHNYKESVPMNLNAQFLFPKKVTDLQPGELEKAEIKAIGDFITKKYVAKKITVTGAASPEGPYDKNVMLSKDRSKHVQEWLSKQLSDAGYTQQLDSTFWTIDVTFEDWAGFKKNLDNQPYSPDVKKQITEIVSAGFSEDKREKLIMDLVGGKEKVEFLLAPLRISRITVEGFEPRRTAQEIDKLAQDFVDGKLTGNIKDTFEKEEWLYAISRHKSEKGKRMLLEAYRDAYPTDGRAFNDLGILAMQAGDKEKGYEYLEKASKLAGGKDPGILNNLGAAGTANHHYKEAKANLEASLAGRSSNEANYNLGVVLEKMGRYSMAVEKFNAASSVAGAKYNAGLCKLLMQDYTGAKASFNEATKEKNDNAWAYYTMAIVGARTGDIGVMSLNLKKACDMDGSLKSKASKDLEFRKYYTNVEFKKAIE